jgi:hypothetical protein
LGGSCRLRWAGAMQSNMRGGAALASGQDEQANGRVQMKCDVFSEPSDSESKEHIGWLRAGLSNQATFFPPPYSVAAFVALIRHPSPYVASDRDENSRRQVEPTSHFAFAHTNRSVAHPSPPYSSLSSFLVVVTVLLPRLHACEPLLRSSSPRRRRQTLRARALPRSVPCGDGQHLRRSQRGGPQWIPRLRQPVAARATCLRAYPCPSAALLPRLRQGAELGHSSRSSDQT